MNINENIKMQKKAEKLNSILTKMTCMSARNSNRVLKIKMQKKAEKLNSILTKMTCMSARNSNRVLKSMSY